MRQRTFSSMVMLGFILLWCSIVCATAVPKDIVVMIDNSGSMKKGDPQFLTKEAIADFIGGLSDNTRLAVLIFDHRVNLAVSLTSVSDTAKEEILTSLDNMTLEAC